MNTGPVPDNVRAMALNRNNFARSILKSGNLNGVNFKNSKLVREVLASCFKQFLVLILEVNILELNHDSYNNTPYQMLPILEYNVAHVLFEESICGLRLHELFRYK